MGWLLRGAQYLRSIGKPLGILFSVSALSIGLTLPILGSAANGTTQLSKRALHWHPSYNKLRLGDFLQGQIDLDKLFDHQRTDQGYQLDGLYTLNNSLISGAVHVTYFRSSATTNFAVDSCKGALPLFVTDYAPKGRASISSRYRHVDGEGNFAFVRNPILCAHFLFGVRFVDIDTREYFGPPTNKTANTEHHLNGIGPRFGFGGKWTPLSRRNWRFIRGFGIDGHGGFTSLLGDQRWLSSSGSLSLNDGYFRTVPSHSIAFSSIDLGGGFFYEATFWRVLLTSSAGWNCNTYFTASKRHGDRDNTDTERKKQPHIFGGPHFELQARMRY